ncbi:MAG: glycosyltransferase family 4 protein [Candidatus Bathyarchaeia archaeon]
MSKIDLAIINTRPPHIYFGGVERRIIEVSKRLAKKINVTVYCGRAVGFKKSVKLFGISFVPCFSTNLFFPLDNWFFNKTLCNNFRSVEADVYEVHTVSGYGLLRALEKRRVSKPFINVIHGVLSDEFHYMYKEILPTPKMKLSKFLMRRLSEIEREIAQKSTMVVTVSEYSYRKIVELYGVEKEKVKIVPNGVDTLKFKFLSNCEGIKKKLGIENRPCILFVGNLIPRKGLNYLIEAARYIVKSLRNATFLIVGNGPLKNYLISYAKRLGVHKNFIFLGEVSDNILPKIYNCADVFVLPSLQEGQGITLLEAQASAKPVVAFNVGGVRECVRQNETGLLVEQDSFKLAEAILELLNDEPLRIRMGMLGRKFVCERFSWDLCAEKMLEIYNFLQLNEVDK